MTGVTGSRGRWNRTRMLFFVQFRRRPKPRRALRPTSAGTERIITMGAITTALIKAATTAAKVPASDTVDTAAEVLAADADAAWLVDEVFATKGMAGTGGYHYKNAVGAKLNLPTNDDGGYPGLRSEVKAVLDGFTLDAPDGDLIRMPSAIEDADTIGGYVAVIRRSGQWTDPVTPDAAPEVQPEADAKPAPKARGKAKG